MRGLIRSLRYDWPLHFILLLTNWLPDNVAFIRFRGVLARPFFKSCGSRLGIGRNVTFYNPSKIVIGNSVYIAFGSWFSGGYGITIEDEVLFGPYSVVATSDHTMMDGSYRFGKPNGAPVVIGRGSWLGAHVTILKGVYVGRGCLVAANSVVTGSVAPFSVVGGVPGRVIKTVSTHSHSESPDS